MLTVLDSFYSDLATIESNVTKNKSGEQILVSKQEQPPSPPSIPTVKKTKKVIECTNKIQDIRKYSNNDRKFILLHYF